MPRLRSILLLSLLIASPASAVTIDWVVVGSPRNAADPQTTLGAVADNYRISKYEVTNAQYTEFLNAVADADPNELYQPFMGDAAPLRFGGIIRNGSSGNYTYQTIAGRENMPVNYVSFYDALRFTNWMNNGQPSGAQGIATTESGAYTITPQGVAENSIARNTGASVFLPSSNEWYKAAYYDPSTSSYYDFPARSDAITTCAAPTAAPNTANCEASNHINDFSSVGSYRGSASPYGTLDQGGNAFEWNDDASESLFGRRISRGGGFRADVGYLAAYIRSESYPDDAGFAQGFRLASVIPEPGTGLLVAAGLIGLAASRTSRVLCRNSADAESTECRWVERILIVAPTADSGTPKSS